MLLYILTEQFWLVKVIDVGFLNHLNKYTKCIYFLLRFIDTPKYNLTSIYYYNKNKKSKLINS